MKERTPRLVAAALAAALARPTAAAPALTADVAVSSAAAGAVGGLLIAVFAVPHDGPDRGLDKMKP